MHCKELSIRQCYACETNEISDICFVRQWIDEFNKSVVDYYYLNSIINNYTNLIYFNAAIKYFPELDKRWQKMLLLK